MNLALILSALLLTLAAIDSHGAGVVWDLFNGVGIVAFAFFLALQVETLRGSRVRGGSGAGAIETHTHLAYLALGAVVVHAAGLLIADEMSWEYVTVRAPLYMAAGLASVALLVWLAMTSTTSRRRAIGAPARFQSLHRIGSLALLALVTWHVIGSGYYFASIPARAVVLGATAGCAFMPSVVSARSKFATAPGTALTTVIAASLIGVFTLVRNL